MMKIGFYDSGIGGLTILKAVSRELPEYDYLYYGDTAQLPLGDKTEQEIYECTQAGMEYLFARGCALVIIACNTASAETLRRLQDEFLPQAFLGRKILGVIIPVVEEVIESGCRRVKLIATARTVSSGKYHLELGKRNIENVKIEALATPTLVPLIEAGHIEHAISEATSLVGSPADLKTQGIDGVILGCTHYTLLASRLQARYGSSVRIFSQDAIVPSKLRAYLAHHPEISAQLSTGRDRTIHLSKHSSHYDDVAADLLQR